MECRHSSGMHSGVVDEGMKERVRRARGGGSTRQGKIATNQSGQRTAVVLFLYSNISIYPAATIIGTKSFNNKPACVIIIL